MDGLGYHGRIAGSLNSNASYKENGRCKAMGTRLRGI